MPAASTVRHKEMFEAKDQKNEKNFKVQESLDSNPSTEKEDPKDRINQDGEDFEKGSETKFKRSTSRWESFQERFTR